MRISRRIAALCLAGALSLGVAALAQNPFDDTTGVSAAPASPFADPAAPPTEMAAPEPPAPASPFTAPLAPEDTAPLAPEDTAPVSPFAAPIAPEDAAAMSPFDDTPDAAPVSPFADLTGDSPASPFGDPGLDTGAFEDVGAVANITDPITYWYTLEFPEGAAEPDPNAPPPPPGQEAPGPDISQAKAVREEIPYSEYKRRYNERVQAIQLTMQGPQAQPYYNQQQQQQQQVDPTRAMAEWKVYYEQMEAWKKYVEDTVLGAQVGASIDDIDFPNLDQAGIEDAIESLRLNVQDAADKATGELENRMIAMVERLDQRKKRRNTYYDWRAEQEAVFIDFAERWIMQSEGLEINIDGNLYLISERPIQSAPYNVLPVVTTNLTPYDIFNEDGTLKRPQ